MRNERGVEDVYRNDVRSASTDSPLLDRPVQHLDEGLILDRCNDRPQFSAPLDGLTVRFELTIVLQGHIRVERHCVCVEVGDQAIQPLTDLRLARPHRAGCVEPIAFCTCGSIASTMSASSSSSCLPILTWAR